MTQQAHGATVSGSVEPIFFEDIRPGETLTSSAWDLTEAEIMEFGSRWDPLPIHVDPEAARKSMFGGLTASGAHLLAIKQRLLHDFGFSDSVVCSFGLDEVRYLKPGRAGDQLHIELEWLESRASSSNPQTGIAKHAVTLLNQSGEKILSVKDTILIRRRAVA